MSEHSKPVILPWRKWASCLDEYILGKAEAEDGSKIGVYPFSLSPQGAGGLGHGLVSFDNVTVLESPLLSPDGLVPFKRIPQIIVETRE